MNAEMWALQAPNSHGPIASYQKTTIHLQCTDLIIIFRMANGLGRRPVMANLNLGDLQRIGTCSPAPVSPTPVSPTPVSPTLDQKVAFRLLVHFIHMYLGINVMS